MNTADDEYDDIPEPAPVKKKRQDNDDEFFGGYNSGKVGDAPQYSSSGYDSENEYGGKDYFGGSSSDEYNSGGNYSGGNSSGGFTAAVRPKRERDYNKRDYSSKNDAREQQGEQPKNKVVNIHATTQLQVVIVKPERYDDAPSIADHLKHERTVLLNLENANREVTRRLIDFLSGVAYTKGGQLKKVAQATYIITPINVDLMGDLLDELENSGFYI